MSEVDSCSIIILAWWSRFTRLLRRSKGLLVCTAVLTPRLVGGCSLMSQAVETPVAPYCKNEHGGPPWSGLEMKELGTVLSNLPVNAAAVGVTFLPPCSVCLQQEWEPLALAQMYTLASKSPLLRGARVALSSLWCPCPLLLSQRGCLLLHQQDVAFRCQADRPRSPSSGEKNDGG